MNVWMEIIIFKLSLCKEVLSLLPECFMEMYTLPFWEGVPVGTIKTKSGGFPGGAVVESLPANAGDAGLGPGLEGSRVPRSGWAR